MLQNQNLTLHGGVLFLESLPPQVGGPEYNHVSWRYERRRVKRFARRSFVASRRTSSPNCREWRWESIQTTTPLNVRIQSKPSPRACVMAMTIRTSQKYTFQHVYNILQFNFVEQGRKSVHRDPK